MPDPDPDLILVRLPYSEVCMHLRVAGEVRQVRIVGTSYPAAQLLDADGTPFSIPITLGEAGVRRVYEARQAADTLDADWQRHRRACETCQPRAHLPITERILLDPCPQSSAMGQRWATADADREAAEAEALR